MENEQVRTFVAIELPGELKNRIGEFQAGIKKPGQGFVKWVDPKLMHLTLKFLGNQSAAKLEIIKRCMAMGAASNMPFTLTTGQTGYFPGPQKVRVFWLGLDGDINKLISLQRSVDELLEKEGFPREARPFTAHLTLARLKDECSLVDRSAFAVTSQSARFETGSSFIIDHIALMKSALTPKGPIYTKLAEYKLTANIQG